MSKILNIISSPLGELSNTIRLSRAIIEQLIQRDPEAEVKIKDLNSSPYPHLEAAQLSAFFTPEDQRSPLDNQATLLSDEAIKELIEADVLVIGAPMYNFGIPSVLKAWFDHITRPGVTFQLSAEGPIGLVKDKKAYIAVASGGVYSQGPAVAYDQVTPYLRTILGFIGITDVVFFRAEGFSVPALKETALANAIAAVAV